MVEATKGVFLHNELLHNYRIFYVTKEIFML